MAHSINRKTWIIYKSKYDNAFVTSDNPVLLYDIKTEKTGLFKAGLGYDSTVLCYPISPKLMISIYSNNMMFGQIFEMRNRICFLYDNDKSFIDKMNALQLKQCIRQVYSKDKK